MLQAVRGMPDRFGVAARSRQHVIDTLRKVVESASFEQVQTPVLEPSELYTRSLGQNTDVVSKEMYTMQDRSGNSLTLRPEGTAGVVRAILNAGTQYNLPQRLWYAGCMFRYERPQRGRFREFQQFGAELIGASGVLSDIEAIVLASESLSALDIPSSEYKLLINTLGDQSSRVAYEGELLSYLTKYKSDLSQESQHRLERKSCLRILDSKSAQDRVILSERPDFASSLSKDSLLRFEKIQKALSDIGIPYTVDSCLVRGLDYYSHTVFEFTETSSNPNALVAGGRYCDLFQQLGGPANVECIGWAAGVDRLASMISKTSAMSKPLEKKIAIIPVTGKQSDDSDIISVRAFEIGRKLMKNDDSLSIMFCHGDGSVKKKMKQADRANCYAAVFVGQQELVSHSVSVKLMQKSPSRSQQDTQSISMENLSEFLKN